MRGGVSGRSIPLVISACRKANKGGRRERCRDCPCYLSMVWYLDGPAILSWLIEGYAKIQT